MRRGNQRGYIFKRSGVWVLRYRITINQGGSLETVQKAKVLAPVDANHKTKASVRPLAVEHLATINKYRTEPETVVTIGDFVTRVYLPFVEAQKRPSTAKGYGDGWNGHLKSRCASVLLRDVRTKDVQRWLEVIAAEDRTPSAQALSHRTLKHLKSLASGIFAHAKRQGYFDGENPVKDTATPPAPKAGETYAYSLEEIVRMLMILPEPAATIVATAAFTGARRGELRGMRWENYHDGAIYVESSVWESHTTEPKTRASKAPIPVISRLAAMLENHRLRTGSPSAGPMFAATNGKPFGPNNVLNRAILPALRKAELEWHGWHAFRRGLATNLYRLGVSDKTIQAILRHSNLATTMNVYVKNVSEDSASAMQLLDAAMSPVCSDCAQIATPAFAGVVN